MTPTLQSTDAIRHAISFDTQGEWQARELAHLFGTLEACYAVFLVLDSLPSLEGGVDALTFPSWELAEAAAYLTKGWVRPWLTQSGNIRYLLPHDLERHRDQFLVLLEASVYRRERSLALRVDRLAMASPGGFSLSGLGEPLREFREFVKDLWYRNRQERAAGDIALEAAKVHLARLRAAPYRNPDGVDNASIILTEGASELLKLKSQERLFLPPGDTE